MEIIAEILSWWTFISLPVMFVLLVLLFFERYERQTLEDVNEKFREFIEQKYVEGGGK